MAAGIVYAMLLFNMLVKKGNKKGKKREYKENKIRAIFSSIIEEYTFPFLEIRTEN